MTVRIVYLHLFSDQHFELSPDRFTLENLFAMQLHRYQNVVEEIIANAVRELETERGVNKIEDVWKGMHFTVVKHVKRNDDRCIIMGPVDDILVALDDNALQLQFMAASQ
jgi:dynein heavy chain